MKRTTITPVFVDSIPEELNEGVMYISETHNIIVHRCCCGCGLEVVTPLSPVDWQLRKNGQTISIKPSIGNWNYPCKSHYWIINNRVEWAGSISSHKIRQVQDRDRRDKKQYIAHINAQKATANGQVKRESWLEHLWATLKKMVG